MYIALLLVHAALSSVLGLLGLMPTYLIVKCLFRCDAMGSDGPSSAHLDAALSAADVSATSQPTDWP